MFTHLYFDYEKKEIQILLFAKQNNAKVTKIVPNFGEQVKKTQNLEGS